MDVSLLNLLPYAEDDLLDIWNYTLEKWRKSQAEIYINSLLSSCLMITASPYIGKVTNELGNNLRAYLCQHHYIFYLEEPENIIFVAFIHKKRDLLRQILNRLPPENN